MGTSRPKVRIHDLSKELCVTSGIILARCREAGIDSLSHHMSVVGEELAERIRKWFSGSELN